MQRETPFSLAIDQGDRCIAEVDGYTYFQLPVTDQITQAMLLIR